MSEYHLLSHPRPSTLPKIFCDYYNFFHPTYEIHSIYYIYHLILRFFTQLIIHLQGLRFKIPLAIQQLSRFQPIRLTSASSLLWKSLTRSIRPRRKGSLSIRSSTSLPRQKWQVLEWSKLLMNLHISNASCHFVLKNRVLPTCTIV